MASYAEEIPNNEIWYTSNDGQVINPHESDVFGANIVSNTYENGRGIIKFDGNVTSVGDYAFACCGGLTSIRLPNTVTEIGYDAFEDCQFTSFIIPNSVKQIRASAFNKNPITGITIPESVIDLSSGAFEGCFELNSIVVEEGNTIYDSRDNSNAIFHTGDNILFTACNNTQIPKDFNGEISFDAWRCVSKPIYDDETFFFPGAVDGEYSIPDGIKTIYSQAFYGREDLTKINIPQSVQNIGERAFAGCANLTSFDITSNKGVSIDYVAFGYCENLSSVVLPDSAHLKADAFSNCPNLSYVQIPASVQGIGCVFCNCPKLETAGPIGGGYNIEFGWTEALPDHALQDCNSLKSVKIPNTVKSIGSAAFSWCSNLESIVVEDGNWKYDSRDNCNAIIETETNTILQCCKNTILPNDVENVGDGVLDGIEPNAPLYNNILFLNMPRNYEGAYTVPEGIRTISDGAFWGCGRMTSIVLPQSATNIGYAAFYNCSELQTIIVDENNPRYVSYNNALIEKGSNVLIRGCSSSIIPNGITFIGDYAFNDCKDLTQIFIPKSVTGIGREAFGNCPLKSIIVDWTTPISLSDDIGFWECPVSEITLYVPTGTKSLYENALVWKDFGTIIELNNALTLGTNDVLHGSQVTIPVNMKNVDEISAVQFDLYLPKGITIAQDEDGYDMVEIAGRSTIKKHNTIETSAQADGAIRVMCASSKNATFDGNEGAILNITFNVADVMKRGTYDIIMRNITLSTAESEGFEQKMYVGALNVYDYEQGDVSEDYKVNVVDYTTMKDIIDGAITDGIKVQLADFNGNGSVNAEDQSALAEKILVFPAEENEEPEDNPYYDNMLVLDETIGFTGNQMTLPVSLTNSSSISAVQFDIILPTGITLAKDDDDNAIISLSGRTTAEAHNTIKTFTLEEGCVRVLCASTANDAFSGNNGKILSLTLNVDKGMTEGDYLFKIKNVAMSSPSSECFEQQFFKSAVKVSSYEMGDLNKDRSINVVDYTAMVDMIMHPETSKFPLELADFDSNGKVDVVDITALTTKIMHVASNTAKARMASRKNATSAVNRLSLIPFTITPGEEKEISLHMYNDDAISAYQTDIVLPEGLEIVKEDDYYMVEVATRTTYKRHNTMEAEMLTDGSIRLMCASSKNATFDGNEGEVAVITVKASELLEPGLYDITLKNTTLSTADSQGFDPESCETSILVGSPEIASAALHGDYTADAISELNTALASNAVLSAIDFTEATSVDATTEIKTGNKNLLVYVTDGTSVKNSQNVVEGDECESLVLTDGYNFAVPKAFTATSASYSRTAPAAYGTIVLPFVPTTSGAEFYELTGAGTTSLEFQKTVSPMAGTPYLYSATSDDLTAANAEVAVSEAGRVTASGWTMWGTYSKKVFNAEDNVYAVSEGKLYHNTGTLTMNPFRAYFTGSAPGASMSINIDGTTVIGTIENGELTSDNTAYNLAGQKVGKSYKGIVITNGRKEIRK